MTSTTTRTPGPWMILSLGPGVDHAERWALWPDCGVQNRHNLIADINGTANARLIAAAPELLEACRAFVEAWDRSHQLEKTDVAVRLARIAIAKAEGTPG